MNDLLKNKLERKTENFWNLMAKNAEIKTLTPEQYLEAIDKEHGTKYAPTGATRLY